MTVSCAIIVPGLYELITYTTNVDVSGDIASRCLNSAV